MMCCNHEYTNQEGRALEKQVIQLEQQLAAAKAELAETYTDEHGTVWTRPTAWAYAAVCKANDKNREAKEQAEAQCAAMRNCDNCNKWCMKQPNNSEFDTLNRMDDCKFNNLSRWELSKKIAKAALEEKPRNCHG